MGELDGKKELIESLPEVELQMHQVSKTVNSPKNDNSECIKPSQKRCEPADVSSAKEGAPRQRIALIDCNNFYVSCERVFDPTLVGKPVIEIGANYKK